MKTKTKTKPQQYLLRCACAKYVNEIYAVATKLCP